MKFPGRDGADCVLTSQLCSHSCPSSSATAHNLEGMLLHMLAGHCCVHSRGSTTAHAQSSALPSMFTYRHLLRMPECGHCCACSPLCLCSCLHCALPLGRMRTVRALACAVFCSPESSSECCAARAMHRKMLCLRLLITRWQK